MELNEQIEVMDHFITMGTRDEAPKAVDAFKAILASLRKLQAIETASDLREINLPDSKYPVGEFERMELYRSQKEANGTERVLNCVRERLKLKDGDSVIEALDALRAHAQHLADKLSNRPA